MAISSQSLITSLVCYPIKGLAGIEVPRMSFTAGKSAPADRIYAIEGGGNRFDPHNPKWLPKATFLQLMRHERLATLSLSLSFEESTHVLTLFRDGKQLAKGALNTKLGRQMIEQFLAAYLKSELRGPPRIVSADGHSFTDIAAKALHIVNLETVRDVSRVTGIELDPLRFRANLYLDGMPAWSERNWTGKTITCGTVQLGVFNETGRCEATSVDPKTAQRGSSIPAAIERTWGHTNLGVYAKVKTDGDVAVGDAVTVAA